MAAAWEAAWTAFQVVLFMPSAHADVFQHNKSGVTTSWVLKQAETYCTSNSNIVAMTTPNDVNACAALCQADSSCTQFDVCSHHIWCRMCGPSDTVDSWPTCNLYDAQGGAGSAVGDPHLRNMHGERFDLLKEGKSVLISIPRGKVGKDLLLAVEATARSLGGQCADTYFLALNITGAWASRVKPGGLRFDASSASDEEPKWTKFGPVDLKVVTGRTASGIRYLNVYVKNLGRAGFDVGGLLGSDDHSEVSTPTQECVKRVALSSRLIMNDGPKGKRASVAEAAI